MTDMNFETIKARIKELEDQKNAFEESINEDVNMIEAIDNELTDLYQIIAES